MRADNICTAERPVVPVRSRNNRPTFRVKYRASVVGSGIIQITLAAVLHDLEANDGLKPMTIGIPEDHMHQLLSWVKVALNPNSCLVRFENSKGLKGPPLTKVLNLVKTFQC